MNIYLAVSMTNAHNPIFLRQVVEHIHSLGHKVLSEHVAAPNKEESTQILVRNGGLDPASLATMDSEVVALLIRDTDFGWVERCDAFIALFFGGSVGRGAEFEHLGLLLELKTRPRDLSMSRFTRIYDGGPNCRGILGVFDKEAISRLIWAANDLELEYYHRVKVNPADTRVILNHITSFLSEIEQKGVVHGQVYA